jgi:hypothetical protein
MISRAYFGRTQIREFFKTSTCTRPSDLRNFDSHWKLTRALFFQIALETILLLTMLTVYIHTHIHGCMMPYIHTWMYDVSTTCFFLLFVQIVAFHLLFLGEYKLLN